MYVIQNLAGKDVDGEGNPLNYYSGKHLAGHAGWTSRRGARVYDWWVHATVIKWYLWASGERWWKLVVRMVN